MAGLEVRSSIQGVGKALKLMEDIQRRSGDFRPLWKRLAIVGFKDIMEHFSEEKGPEGPWKKLSQRTIDARRQGPKKGRGVRILQDTGLLRNSLHPSSPNAFQEVILSTNRVILRTNVKYASTHEFGRGGIPARRFMWVSDKARDQMQDVAAKWVAKGQS